MVIIDCKCNHVFMNTLWWRMLLVSERTCFGKYSLIVTFNQCNDHLKSISNMMETVYIYFKTLHRKKMGAHIFQKWSINYMGIRQYTPQIGWIARQQSNAPKKCQMAGSDAMVWYLCQTSYRRKLCTGVVFVSNTKWKEVIHCCGSQVNTD